jgi:hypothetical protein
VAPPVLFAPLMLQDPSLSETSIAFSWEATSGQCRAKAVRMTDHDRRP